MSLVPSPPKLPPASEQPPDPTHGPPTAVGPTLPWWSRKLWKLPVWAWMSIVVVLAAAASGGNEDEPEQADAATATTVPASEEAEAESEEPQPADQEPEAEPESQEASASTAAADGFCPDPTGGPNPIELGAGVDDCEALDTIGRELVVETGNATGADTPAAATAYTVACATLASTEDTEVLSVEMARLLAALMLGERCAGDAANVTGPSGTRFVSPGERAVVTIDLSLGLPYWEPDPDSGTGRGCLVTDEGKTLRFRAVTDDGTNVTAGLGGLSHSGDAQEIGFRAGRLDIEDGYCFDLTTVGVWTSSPVTVEVLNDAGDLLATDGPFIPRVVELGEGAAQTGERSGRVTVGERN